MEQTRESTASRGSKNANPGGSACRTGGPERIGDLCNNFALQKRHPPVYSEWHNYRRVDSTWLNAEAGEGELSHVVLWTNEI